VSEENAVEGIDYEIPQTLIVIPAGEYVGTLLFESIDNDGFDAARRVRLTINQIEGGSIESSAENTVTVTILNDDCPVNTSIWAGEIPADEEGYPYLAFLSPNEAGDCDVLLYGNIGDYGYLGTLKSVTMSFTPDSDEATFGTVVIPKQTLGIVSDGAGGYTGSGERSVEGSGVYDESTKLIIIDLTFTFGSGGLWYSATTTLDGN
jgi:hypothetical protein